ncbi:hypothetical protein N7527_004990 [Penicillium freii]|nr:hypothetical protein N7527_004990 [Penicillium freii]
MKFLRHVVTYRYLYDIQDHQILPLRAMVAQIEMLRPAEGSLFASPDLEQGHSMEHLPQDDFKHDGVPFRGLCDILGLLLSSMGNAPTGANSRTFYLPLVAMYGRRCKREKNEVGSSWEHPLDGTSKQTPHGRKQLKKQGSL